jgi:hypothetical protein
MDMLIERNGRGMNSASEAEPPDLSWRSLYRVGGAAALITAVLIPIQVVVFIVWPPPFEGTATDWFTLFRDNPLVGLLDLDLLLVADNVFLVPIFLALYILLRRGSESVMAIATALGFLGIVFFIASNPAFEMLSLSDQHAAATTDAQRAIFLAAGEAMVAAWQGSTFQVAYLLGSVAGIAVGVLMLRSAVFSNVTGYMAILGNAVGLGLYVPVVGVYISVFSVLFLEVWYILIGRRLLQLGKRVSRMEASR